jgi:glycine/D-amino acid oxidase-like deaminating enzyme
MAAPRAGDSLPAQADVVVVGGGILGVASAYQLVKRGLQVVLLEKSQIGGAQSGRSLGFVRQQGRAPEELPMMIASNALWRDLEAELDADIEWVQGGNLRLTNDPVIAANYEKWANVGAEFGLGTRVLTKDQVAEILPGVAKSWLMAIFTPSDGHADPLKTTQALAAAAVGRGACLVEGCAVSSILTAGGRVSGVETARGTIRCAALVLAAGATSGRLARPLGLDIPQRLVRSTAVLTEPFPPVTKAAVWAGSLAFRQTREGRFMVMPGGAGDVDLRLENFRQLRHFLPMYLHNRSQLRLQFVPGVFLASLRHRAVGNPEPEPQPNRSDVRRCMALMNELFPHLEGVKASRAWAGNIEGTPDALPVLDAPQKVDGLIIATGSSGHGFGMGPIIGVVVADLVTRGTSQFDLHPMRLSRFFEGGTTARHLL